MFVLNGGVESSSEYQIERSLRLRKSATGHLTRTNGVYGSLQRLTFSAWVKRGALVDCMLLNAGLSVAADDQIRFNASHQLQVNLNNGTTAYTFTSTAVFRDVSAWYHIVVSIDTTKSANADKVRVWVNNALCSMTVSGSLPIGYTFTGFNTPKTHYIGKWYNGAGYEFDGYIAEVYFIDGEALTPTAFGEFDKYGYWSALPYEPLVYSGFTQFPDSVVGGDPYYNNVTVLVHSNGTNGQTTFTDSSSSPKTLTRIGTTQISTAQSKFGGSSLFNGAVNAGNSLNVANSLANILVFSGDFTVECWFYQTADTEYNFSGLITQLNTNSRSSSSISSFELGVYTYTPTLNVFHTATTQYHIAGTVTIEYNVWNHVAVTRSGNLLKMFVNGMQSGTTQTLSGAMVSNTSQPMIGGSNQSGTTRHSFKGYIDDVRITNGVARYTSDFLVNKSNSFYLPFTNTASVSTLGNDFSGNSNNWTPTNVSLSYNSRYSGLTPHVFAAPSYDSMYDVPLGGGGSVGNGLGNYATLNSTNMVLRTVSDPIISDGNLSVKSGSSNSSTGGFVGTQEMRSGKWYHEAHITNIHQFNNVDIGIIGSKSNSTLFANQNSCYAAFSNGLSSNAIVKNGVLLQTSITTVSVGDIISCAVDLDNGTCKFYLNNAQFGTTVTGLTLGISYVFWGYGGTSSLGMVPDMSCNFGQYPFAYTPPAGFKALHTGNLPAPVIPQPNLYFDTVTYNGGGTYPMPTAAFPDSVGAGDPNFASVTTLMHFDGGFGDSSSSPNTFTNFRATISTAQKKFGTHSALFNGTSSRITTPYSTDYVFGSGDFTVECWIYPLAYTNPASAVISFWSNTQGWAWELGLTGSNPYASFNGNIYVYAPVVSLNAWHHLCVSRRGPTIALYVDGVFGNSINFGTTAIIPTGAQLTIGCVSTPNTWYFNGYIDEVRITKGVARYDISRQIINPANLQPDLVWIKGRGTTANHQLIDSARGVTKSINSNTSNIESTDVTLLSSFNANGFNLGSSTLTNQGGYVFSAWEWKKGVTPGFDIVTYTGNGNPTVPITPITVNHSLGAVPNLIISKLTQRPNDIMVYHSSHGPTKTVWLNRVNAVSTNIAYWGNTAPTSTQFTVGLNNNYGGEPCVNYLFAAVPGFSAFGAYTGNASTDGPFIYTGFSPKYVMLKCSSSTGAWIIHDTTRNRGNVNYLQLYANTNAIEASVTTLDILSNGFKLRTAADPNAVQTYIYMAFAEVPFKYALAR